MEELNICALFILSNQPTTQPAYQPKSDKYAYLWRFSTNLVEIWYGVSKWKDSTYVYDLYALEHGNRPNQPTTHTVFQGGHKSCDSQIFKHCLAISEFFLGKVDIN